VDDRDLDELLEKTSGGDVVTGVEWDRLTSTATDLPDLVVMPRGRRSVIVERLVIETSVADGTAWMKRFEALNRLLTHRRWQQTAVDVCASIARDPSCGTPVEVIAALDGSSHPDAQRHVLAQLVRPSGACAFYGALLASARIVRERRFTPVQLTALATVAGGLVDAADQHEARALAAEILRQLSDQTRDTAVSRLTSRAAPGDAVQSVLASGRLASAHVSRVVCDRLVHRTFGMLDRDLPHSDDRLLTVLVDDILHHPVFDVRLYTSMLIAATPYRRALAAALAAEFSDPRIWHNIQLSLTILNALRILGGPAERLVVERIAVAAGVPVEVTNAATHALGHIGGRSPQRYWAESLSHCLALAGASPGTDRHVAVTNLTYAVGMAGERTLLQQMRTDDRTPWSARATAAWFLDVPQHVRASARL